ncbi:ABC transporter ATP-binding protein [Acetivibrio cellulolyticus]|uniref:ABC transporter ATP-binding protein n=1 Tax=Acetivibrio cellulolyticus TaxID=35830 RepID=UPI0001E2FB93|nr:ATP-binding cassette domain-containing protein [Acetivibrio cellulolyticus]
MAIIEVKNLKKNYHTLEAVKGINFSVKEGIFFAFLGENGAGKSTTINIISTLLRKSSGQVIVNNHELDKDDHGIRDSIGIVFQNNMLDHFLTVRENLISRGRMYGLSKEQLKKRIIELSSDLDAGEIIDKRYGSLSGGQKRKADICRALIHSPKILILDEPTTGLDPYTRQKVWEMMNKLRHENKLTIFLTTHYMEEAAQADYIVVIDKGMIKAEGTPESLRLKYSHDRLIIIPKDQAKMVKQLETLTQTYVLDRDRIIIPIQHAFESLDVIQMVKDNLDSFEVIRGNMDDVFINIIKEEA